MSDPLLPSDVRDSDLDPVTCRRCELLQDKLDIQRDKVEQLQDVLSDALEFLAELEQMTRGRDSGRTDEQVWRKELAECIKQCRKLA